MAGFELGEQLERQLAAYSTANRNIAARSVWRDRVGSWPAYCAATAAALAGATSASASIIYSGPVNLSVTRSAGQSGRASRTFQIAGLPAASFVMNVSHFTKNSTLWGSAGLSFKTIAGFRSLPRAVRRGAVLTSSGLIPQLSAGSVIRNGSTFSHRGKFVSTGIAPSLSARSITGFAGVKLLAGTSAVGTAHIPLYDIGWLHIRIQDLHNIPDTVTLLDYAYNNVPGAPITVPSPEPATAGLLLLAAGAGGVMAWKRRRAAGSPGPQSESSR